MGPFRRAALGMCLLALLSLLAVWQVGPAAAQPAAPAFRVEAAAEGVRISWRLTGEADLEAGGWSLLEIGAASVPGRLLALTLPDDLALAPRVTILRDAPRRALPGSAVTGPQRGPATPVLVLRESRIGGKRVAVLALSPRFWARPGLAWPWSSRPSSPALPCTTPGRRSRPPGPAAPPRLSAPWPRLQPRSSM